MTRTLRGWREWSLASRLAMLLVVFTLVPLAGLILYDGLVGRRQILDAAAARNAVRAAATADAIEAYLASVLADVQVIAQSPPAARILIDTENPIAQEALRRWIGQAREIEHYENLFVTDQSGLVVVADDPRLVGRTYIAAPFFQKAIAGQTVSDGPRYDPADGGTYLHFASPVRSADGVLVGAVVARVTMAPIERIVKADTNFGGAGEFGVLWDERGIRLAGATRLGPLFGPFAPVSPLVQASLAAEQRFGPRTRELLGQTGTYRELVERSRLLLYDPRRFDAHLVVPSADGRLYVAVAPLAERRWLYGIFAPERGLVAGARASTLRLAALGAMAVLLIAAIALVTARVVSRPMRALVTVARSIGSGDLTRRAHVIDGGEVGELARTFNTMLDTLAAKDAELRRYAEDLEHRVKERTAALQVSEEQLRQAQKMEALGRLAGGIAHDFNNLLTAILGNAHFLREELGARPALVDEVDQIVRAGESAATLTSQLLTFSRRQVVQPKVLDLGTMLKKLQTMLHRLIREDIELQISSEPGPLPVKADPGQLEQVILNLAVNARDAMPHGGRLTIAARRATSDEVAAQAPPDALPGDYVQLSVGDTGTGIDPDALPHIFEPFFSTKPRGQGAGLGLATVHGIVLQAGGYVAVETKVGRATTITCFFPRSGEMAAEPPAPRPAAAQAGGSETVLLVEDESALRALAARILRRYGYQVLVAEDSLDALRLAERHDAPIHLLLTDMVMPVMGGPEVAQHVVARRPDTRVLFMSGYSDVAPLQPSQVAPSVGFIQKPFAPEALAKKVREVLDAGRRRDE